MTENKKNIIIIAPHPDDELIGCFEIIERESNILIMYSADTPNERRNEALKLREYRQNIKAQIFQNSIPPTYINDKTTFFFPDPIYEIHPTHRYWGNIGESMVRSGLDVIFYSTLMNVPWIHEVSEPTKKEEILNKVYPSQKLLWSVDKKYILFESRYKWHR